MTQSAFPLLSLITFMPLVGAALILLVPKSGDREIKLIALGASIISLLTTLCVWSRFDPNAGLVFEERWSWIPTLNVDYRLGVDGLEHDHGPADGDRHPAGAAGALEARPECEIVFHSVPAAANRACSASLPR